jgi:hypothetical protein
MSREGNDKGPVEVFVGQPCDPGDTETPVSDILSMYLLPVSFPLALNSDV